MLKKPIPRNIIETASKLKVMDTLVYFMWLRCKFKKPIFYNYNVRKIAYHLNISPTTSSKHIKVMVKLGWAHISNGHLCLYSNNKLKEKTSPVILIQIFSHKKTQLIHLRYVLIRQNTDLQSKQIARKSATVHQAKKSRKSLSKGQVKEIRKSGGLKKYENSYQDKVTLSNRKIGRMFNRSQSTGIRYQKQLRETGLVTSIYRFKEVIFDPFNGFYGNIIRSTKNGRFYSQMSNELLPKL